VTAAIAAALAGMFAQQLAQGKLTNGWHACSDGAG
jgi:hypothetical protein